MIMRVKKRRIKKKQIVKKRRKVTVVATTATLHPIIPKRRVSKNPTSPRVKKKSP